MTQAAEATRLGRVPIRAAAQDRTVLLPSHAAAAAIPVTERSSIGATFH